MKIVLLFFIFVSVTYCDKSKIHKPLPTTATEKKPDNQTKHDSIPKDRKNNTKNISDTKVAGKHKEEKPITMIPIETVQNWARTISDHLLDHEEIVVYREELLKSFSGMKFVERDGMAIADKMAKSLEDLLEKRTQAAEAIMRKAEELFVKKRNPPPTYTFYSSVDAAVVKEEEELGDWQKPEKCKNKGKVPNLTKNYTHFGKSSLKISLEATSVHVSPEVFSCDKRVLPHIYWSENILSTFKQNYLQDAMIDFQYYCSTKGFMRHYPGADWASMLNNELGRDHDVFDCRMRSWYVAAEGAPRDILILLDATGSMTNSSNLLTAQYFTSALLNALTDDDQVNVIRFNNTYRSPITCFNDKLVSANHINTAAMMATLNLKKMENLTNLNNVLKYAVRLLQDEHRSRERPPSCQQGIVLVTDSMEQNFTEYMSMLDPSGRIRLFVIWLHDQFGVRDNTYKYAEWVSCSRDGYFAELISANDVTEHVMQILRVLERPLVAQRKERLRVFSDLYAHMEDPRRGETLWRQKEMEEQKNRYIELRRNKNQFLGATHLLKTHMHHESLDQFGYYYEGQDVDYRLQISVSVPVFENTLIENITIFLNEESQRRATRTYPVNRLLGVAGVDIPIQHLKLHIPYYQVGGGGYLFIVDHRGNIVLHDNLKPTFDGDILRPGYRTVDFLELEQPSEYQVPRNYSQEWIKFRKTIIIEKPKGTQSIFSKNIFEGGMRALVEKQDYYWRRILDHYTAIVVLPKYNRRYGVHEGSFTQKLAEEAKLTLSRTEYSVHPEWLYCRFVDPNFESPESRVLHFVNRRLHDPNFPMNKLQFDFSQRENNLFTQNYLCNEELMARICKDAIVTHDWVETRNGMADHECTTCALGSTTAFVTTESGLTRWKQYPTTVTHAQPPSGSEWPWGPTEPFYKRAVASPDTLVIHAPVTPIRKMRITNNQPPALGIRYQWLTAARTLAIPHKGTIGVAGYHFHPDHLNDILHATTFPPCTGVKHENCPPRCDGAHWSCVLIDEGGWIVAGHKFNRTEEDPIREHLSRVHPQAMSALLKSGAFKLNWVHDYQSVCFPPLKEELPAAATSLPSLLRDVWHSVKLLFHVTREMITLITIFSYCNTVAGDTKLELEKRRNRTRKDFEREKYERLFDSRVLVNRTRFAACDRSRALYEFQRNSKAAKDAFKRQPHQCDWPLTIAIVPKTNLLLVAVLNVCNTGTYILQDPLINKLVNMTEAQWAREVSATRLACWRNRQVLPGRPPKTACYQHNYTQEVGYRQCGPWLPDLEQPEDDDDDVGNIKKSSSALVLLLTILLLYNFT